jgi:hypothetical protein
LSGCSTSRCGTTTTSGRTEALGVGRHAINKTSVVRVGVVAATVVRPGGGLGGLGVEYYEAAA